MEHAELFSLINQYYEKKIGYWPDQESWKTTLKTAWFLWINRFSKQEIWTELDKFTVDTIRPEDLSNTLWNHSYTEKGKFYFHHALQIISPAPIFSLHNGCTRSDHDDWCVPKIRFTQTNLNEYFASKLSQTEIKIWILGHNLEKETQYLLRRFKDSYPDLEPIDYLLYLIDELARDENKQHIKGLISVTDYIGNTLETYSNTILEAKAKGFDKPRWPSCI